MNTTRASAIYLSEDAQTEKEIAILRVKIHILPTRAPCESSIPEPELEPFIHPSAVIDPTARVAKRVAIGACAVIGRNAFIGEDVRIHPNVTIYDDVTSAEAQSYIPASRFASARSSASESMIHNNSVIGCDGFGYAKDEEKRWLKIPQTGRVVIEDDVEIGAGTTIDRASVGESRIGRGSKLDNLVQIGHSCTVGEDSLLCAQVGLAGSSHIGNRVILAGQAGVAGHSDDWRRRGADGQERDESRHSGRKSDFRNSGV